MAGENLVNLRTRIEMGTVEFEDSMTRVNRQLKILRNETKLSKSETELFGKSNRTLGNEMKSLDSLTEGLTVSIKQQKAEYERLREANIKLNGENAKSTKGMDKVANNIQRLSRELTDAERKMQLLSIEMAKQDSTLYQWGNKLESGGKSLETFGKKMDTVANEWMKLSGAMALGVGVVVKSAIDWESSWTSVLKTVSGSSQELEALSQGLRDMSQEIPVSANELAELASVAGQLGIETGKIEKFTEVVAALGVTTNMSAETAAQEFARLANITGMSQDDFDRLGSSIVELGNNFATSEAEISTMALRLAAAGTQVGMSEADILRLSATLSSLGIEAEAGGSAISKILINAQLATSTGLQAMVDLESATGFTRRELELMASNSSKDFKALADAMGMTTSEMQDIMRASKNLENFAEVAGMTGEEFQKAFGEDAIGAMMKFIEGLGGIDTESESAIEKLDAMGISEIRLRDALLRLAGNSDLVTEAVASSNKAWEENTALQDEAALRYGTVQSQLQILRNKLVDVAVSAGEELLPTIIDLVDMAEPLIDSVKEAVKRFSELDEETKKNIIRLGGFVMAGGPVLKFLAGFTTNTGKLTGALGKGLKVITGLDKPVEEIGGKLLTAATGAGKMTLGMTGLATVLATGAVVAGIVAITLALKNWHEEQEESKRQTERWGDTLSDKTKQALTDVQTFNLDAVNELELFNSGLSDSADGVIGAYGNIVDTISSEGKRAVEELDGTFKYLPEELQNTLQYSVNQRKTELDGLVTEARDSEVRITEIMKTAANERRELTAAEMVEVESLQKRLIEIQAEIASENSEVQDGIYEGMFTKISVMNKEQLKQHDQFVTDRRNLEKEDFEKRQQALDEALSDGMVSEEKYNKYIAELDEERTESKNKYYAELYQIQKAAGLSYDELLTTQTASGLTFAELDEIYNERIRESRKGVIEITEEMTEAEVRAAEIWNSLIYNPITGEVNSNTEEVIAQAVSDETKWNDMLFLLHDANIDSNIKMRIKEAMIENGNWNDLTFNEKQAIMETNAEDTAIEFLRASGQWDSLTPEQKNMIMDSNTGETLKQALIDTGVWDKLDPNIQKFIVETNSTDKAKEGKNAIGNWNSQNPKVQKLHATTNAWDTVGQAKRAFGTIGNKSVTLSVNFASSGYSTIRSQMANAMSGAYATYAKGTDYHPGGLAVLGDGGKREPYLTPQGSFGISPSNDTMYALPEGTKVWSSIAKFRQEARQKDILKPLLGKLPHYATGTDFSFMDKPRQQVNQTSSSDSYNIYLTANGDLPDSTIKKMATKIEREIKNIGDRRKTSIGKGVTY